MSLTQNIPVELRDKSVGKSLRFEVFKRDGFTCRYCGAQPPSAVLECDHIHPLAKGGKSTSENLITACHECNRGKSDKVLGDRIVRPDADLMYLQTQQEIAELRRYQDAAAEREAILSEVCETLQDRAWALTDNEWAPADVILLQMLKRYSAEVVDQAVGITAKKIDDGTMRGSWVPYLWGAAKRVNSRLQGS